jgi:hypothetical protein
LAALPAAPATADTPPRRTLRFFDIVLVADMMPKVLGASCVKKTLTIFFLLTNLFSRVFQYTNGA